MIDSEIKEAGPSTLFTTVVNGGFCVGCGACAAVTGSPVKIGLNKYAMLQAFADKDEQLAEIDQTLQAVCPFSNSSFNEDQIGSALYEQEGAVYHNKIGYQINSYAGYVAEGDFRNNGSSGGMGTWILFELFKKGLIDGAIHIHQRMPTNDDPRLFQYQLSNNANDIVKGAKSRYYPIELSEMMSLIRSRPGNYAIVGIPCFIKSVRLLSLSDDVLKERIKFCIGLICGHIKSTRFADMLAWECGIKPGSLESINFRAKLQGKAANQYGVSVTGISNGQTVSITSPPVNEMYGTNWGLGFFKYKACDFCDDVVAETADITIGDAWLPQYVHDSNGTNVIIVRTRVMKDIIEEGMLSGRLNLDHISADEAALSQRSGFDHRRDGLAYRLFLTDAKGEWRPKKRVSPDANGLDEKNQKKQVLRTALAKQSHKAFNEAVKADSFAAYRVLMAPLVKEYEQLYKAPVWKRILKKGLALYRSLNQ